MTAMGRGHGSKGPLQHMTTWFRIQTRHQARGVTSLLGDWRWRQQPHRTCHQRIDLAFVGARGDGLTSRYGTVGLKRGVVGFIGARQHITVKAWGGSGIFGLWCGTGPGSGYTTER